MFFFFTVFSVHLCTNPLLCFSSAQYVQNDSPSSKSLAGLIVQLLQFQEDAFGRRVNNPALTKLPVRHTLLIKTKNRWRLLNPHCCSATFRPNASLISRREALSVTSWGLSTSLRASRGGELMIFLFQTFLKSTFTSDVFKGCLKIHLSTSSLSLSGADLTCRILHGWTGTWRCSWMWRRTWSRYHLISTLNLSGCWSDRFCAIIL